MTENFMMADLFGTSAAFFLFALVIFVPGYVLGWLAEVFGFRQRSLLARFAISTPLSIAVFPILTYLLWRWSLLAAWTLYAVCWIAFLMLLIHERHLWLSKPRVSKRVAVVLAIIAGWVVLGLLCLVDLQIRDRLYSPTVAYDYMLRTAVTAAITRTGIPPHNPYFFPGRPFILRYHYFWFIPCSLVDQFGGSLISARQAMLAGTLWCGVGLIALIPLYLRFFQPRGPINLERRTLIGIALLSVTGLDILPVVFLGLMTRRIFGSIEWWNTAAMAWVHAVLWVPHHVAGLIACLTGFLVIWYAARSQGPSNRILASITAGLSFASAVGLSIYVTFIFAVFLAVWLTIVMFKRRINEAAIICGSGMIALVASSAYLLELHAGDLGLSTGSGPFLQFSIRPFSVADALTETFWPRQPWLVPVADLLSLPVNYFLELGFFFVVAMMQWRKMRRSKDFFGQKELCGIFMAVIPVLICTFLRSSVIANNDLAWRGLLMAQFILLIWGTELLDENVLQPHGGAGAVQDTAITVHRQPFSIVALLVLGVAGSLYEVSMVRFYPVLSDDFAALGRDWPPQDRNLGARTYALRQVYEALKNILPQNAVVQHNPNAVPGDMFYGLYADRQAAAETSQCGVVFGGDTALCPAVIGPINDLLEKPGAVDPSRVDAICRDLSIDALVVKDTDKVWADKKSWVWKKQPILANNYARAFLCGRGVAR